MTEPFRIIDLSLTMAEGTGEPIPIKIERLDHIHGADYFGRKIIFSSEKSLLENAKSFFQYLCGTRRINRKSFPNAEFLSLEEVTASVHSGTHLDAPYHFGTLCDKNKAKTVEEIPLEWCYGNGVVLDLTDKAPGDFILPQDLERVLRKIEYQIKPRDIVLIRTDGDKYWGTMEYFYKFPGMSEEATAYLVERGIKVIGIDSLSFDRPFRHMLADFFRTKDNKYLWPAHLYGRTREYCHLERLANLDQIPHPYGFKVVCFPIKINRVGAAWVRAAAIIGD